MSTKLLKRILFTLFGLGFFWQAAGAYAQTGLGANAALSAGAGAALLFLAITGKTG